MTPAGSFSQERMAGIGLSKAETCSGLSRADLLLEHFFDLSDLLLNFAGVFFGVSFGL
jgi:hypothetical protein